MPPTFPVQRVLVALLLAALAWGVWAELRCAGLRADIAKLEAQHAGERERLATAQTKAVEKARTEARREAFRIQETVDAGHIRLQTVEAAARRAAVESHSLRADLAVYRDAYHALAARDSATAEECRAAARTASVCAGLLDEESRACGEVAAFADRSATAHAVCVGAYRALISSSPEP